VAYVDEVMAGDYEAAYGRLCAKVRGTTTLADFTRIQAAHFNGRVTATVTAQMTQETGATFVQSFPLVKEDGAWRICQ
jgi:hypothetical protein